MLTVIAGILILAVVGSAALSLMTGSVMTVVDGRETVQAAYLAESGKEIVRAQTESKSGEALMDAAILLSESQEDDGKKFVVNGTGFVKTRLYPSWYRVHGSQWETTSFGWYGGAPAGKRAWLAMSSAGAYRYEAQVGVTALGAAAADVYLIGKVQGTPSYNDDKHTLSVTPANDSFQYFPEYGGLIGFVARQPTKKAEEETSVSEIRFLYDRMTLSGNKYVFSNVTVYPKDTSTTAIEDVLANSDVALGQYFRVVCESVTNYGARSALVWHTNGRNSLRYADNGSGSGGEDGVVGGNKVDDLLGIFGGKLKDSEDDDDDENEGQVTGENIRGNLQRDDDELEWDFDDDDEEGNIEINHFLKRNDASANNEDWWVAVASSWLAYDPLESMMQFSFKPDDADDNYFTGILCRLAFVNASKGLSSKGTVRQVYGAKGIGVGVMQGEISFLQSGDEYVVQGASVNPALLPGFRYEKPENEDEEKFIISDTDYTTWYGSNGVLRYHPEQHTRGDDKEEDEDLRNALYPLLVVWAYDDLGENTGSPVQSLRPLAISVLDKVAYLHLENKEGSKDNDWYLSLTVEVEEKDRKNHLKIWLEKNRESCINMEDDFVPWPRSDEKLLKKWDYMAQDVSQGTDGSLSTSFATGEAYRRVGIFSEVYPFGSQNRDYADIVLGNFFFTGTGSGGGSLFPGGLTPGIVN